MPRTRSSSTHCRSLLSLMTPAAHLLSFLAVLITAARADEPAKPTSRVEATAIIANAHRIVTPNGVERLEKLRIGGIHQWVSIRAPWGGGARSHHDSQARDSADPL
jgi:hypothetical protein